MRDTGFDGLPFLSTARRRLRRCGEFLELTRTFPAEADWIARDLGLSAADLLQVHAGDATQHRLSSASPDLPDVDPCAVGLRIPEHAQDLARLRALNDI